MSDWGGRFSPPSRARIEDDDLPKPHGLPSTQGVFWLAVVIGLVVAIGCNVWERSAQESLSERVDRSSRQLDETISALAAGRKPKEIPPPGPPPWPARNWYISGAIAFAITLIAGRLYIFMLRLENRPRA